MPNPPGPPDHPQFVTSVNGLTGNVELPRVLAGWVHPINGRWQVTPPTVHGFVALGEIYLSRGPSDGSVDGGVYLVVTPVNSSAVSCTVSLYQQDPDWFVVDCWDPSGNRVLSEIYFVMVGL